jgi:hypothetical protein
MCALTFYFVNRSCLVFEFVLNSNRFANFKRFKNQKGIPFSFSSLLEPPGSEPDSVLGYPL